MPEKIFLILLIILAIFSITTAKLRQAVIYMGLFSLASSFIFLIYGAPDVAIAEAVIGSAIATVLYLVAIRRYRVFVIYFINHDNVIDNCANQNAEKIAKKAMLRPKKVNQRNIRKSSDTANNGYETLLKNLEVFLMKKEFEPHIIYTLESATDILESKEYDLVLDPSGEALQVFGFSRDYHMDDVEKFLSQEKFKCFNISITRREESVIPNAQMD